MRTIPNIPFVADRLIEPATCAGPRCVDLLATRRDHEAVRQKAGRSGGIFLGRCAEFLRCSRGITVFGFKRWRFARRVSARVAMTGLAAAICCASGCGSLGARNDELSYHGQPERDWYVGEQTKIAHSNFVQDVPEDVQFASEPRTIADRKTDTVRELSLAEVIHIALMNNKIVQTGIQAPVGSKTIFQSGDNIPSVYDQAINETGVLFGTRGVEAALSDFDTTVQTSLTWGRSRTPQNLPGGPAAIAETANFASSLSKQFATGASLQFFSNWDYLGTNSTSALFPSSFSGNSGVAFRQPLLAGSGVDFTRTAGPANPGFGAITGVSQGVLIARINSDISLTRFEASVRDSVRDVQKAYWALYLSYRNYQTSVVAHRSAYQTWKEAKIRLEVGTLKGADEAQALEQFYATQAMVEASLNQLYQAETGLRRLLGLQLNDGEIIRPSDKPLVADFLPDWRSNLAEALTRRVELRRQKWNIKSLQLQLTAARSLVRPQLDIVAGAQSNGLGDSLIGGRTDGLTNRGLGSGFGSLLSSDFGSWNAGFEFSVPLGFRSATAQVRNYELRVAKARAVLSQTEREIAHDVTTSIQDVVASYISSVTNEERLIASRRRVELLELERQEGTTTLDMVLRAQNQLAQAEGQYYSRIVDFANAMIDLEYSKGSLLASTGIQLAEGGWDACAYQDALRRACERTYALENDHLSSCPEPFASPTPVSSPEIGILPDHIPHENDPLLEDGPEILIKPYDEPPAREPEVAPLPPGFEELEDFPDDNVPDAREDEAPEFPSDDFGPDAPDDDAPLLELPDIARFGSGWESAEPVPAAGTTAINPNPATIIDAKDFAPLPSNGVSFSDGPISLDRPGSDSRVPAIPVTSTNTDAEFFEHNPDEFFFRLGQANQTRRGGAAKKIVRPASRPRPLGAEHNQPGPNRLLPAPRLPEESPWEDIPGPFGNANTVEDYEPRPLPPRVPSERPVNFDDLFGPLPQP